MLEKADFALIFDDSMGSNNELDNEVIKNRFKIIPWNVAINYTVLVYNFFSYDIQNLTERERVFWQCVSKYPYPSMFHTTIKPNGILGKLHSKTRI